KEKISFSVTSPLSEADTTFELTRGIVVRGRVIDAATQQPVKARVEYFGYGHNPHVQALANDLWPYAHAMTDENGNFTIAVLPGPGTLAVWTRLSSSVPDQYRPVDPKDFGAPADDRGMVSTANGGLISPANYKAARFIDLKPGDTPPFVDFTVKLMTDMARVRCVDPEGQPLQGVSVIGHMPWNDNISPIENAGLERDRGDRIYIEIAELGAESRKPVVFRHRERHLGAILFGSRSERRPRVDDLKQADDGVHLVPLLPTASITGQLVDEEGQPVRSGEVELHYVTDSGSQRGGIELTDVRADQNGRFELRDLPAGGPYLLAGGDASHGGGILKRDIELVAGQTLDLGTLNVTKAEPAKPQKVTTPTTSTDTTKPNNNAGIQGRVVGPDGKPVEAADLYWLSWRMREQPRKKPQLLATTDADGLFRFTLPAAMPVHNQAVELLETQMIAVTGKGTGLALVRPHELGRGSAAKSVVGQILTGIAGAVSPLTISLPADDVPLRGRIVDIDGAPVAGAKVHLREISDPKSDTRAVFHGENVDGEDAVWRRRLMDMLMQFAPPQLAEVFRPVTADAEGRFTFHGLGRDRLVELLVEGERIESTLFLARTENGSQIRVEPDQNYLLLPATIHGAEFTQVVGPSKPLTGRALDLDTGEPIAGAVVQTFKIHSHPLHTTREREYLATITDAEGRYRITGLPIGNDNKLVALAPQDQPYVPVGHTVDMSADGAEIQQDFRMKRGVWAQGRVYDAQTNEALTGKLDYYIFRNPDLEREIPGLREAHVDEHYFTDADGNFRIPVLRTRGVLGFWYSGPKDATAYPRGAGAEEIEGADDQNGRTMKMYPTLPHYLIADNYWKVAEVNPSAGDEVVKVDMALSSGRTATVRLTDASGRPLTNVDVHGKNWGWEQGKGPDVEVIGLQPGQDRKVLTYHSDLRLAGAATISDKSAEPV
ncbi:MAG TPA: carboxypeptidase-like regulatory domain-containing protein, partial [Lacipirellulaceae bacterium]|nr:carboxypeptidase-like regulatory domain-containing protein [Lacipirellulaceae bacterium]